MKQVQNLYRTIFVDRIEKPEFIKLLILKISLKNN